MRSFYIALVFGLASLISASQDAVTGNWSVQLLADLKPDELTVSQWNEAVDVMITKSEAYIISDMLENFSIAHEIPEDMIRSHVDEERKVLDLPALPPFQVRPSPRDLLNKYQQLAEEGIDEEDFREYLPAGWTDETYHSHNKEDVEALTPEEKGFLRKRAEQRTIAAMANVNTGHLELLPDSILAPIAEAYHEKARKAAKLPEGVRVYKREVSPLAQVVEINGFEQFGLMMYRTWYKDAEMWKTFLKALEQVNGAQLNGTVRGTGMDVIREKFVMGVVDNEEVLEGRRRDDLIKLFTNLKSSTLNNIPRGLDVGMVLMADRTSIESIALSGSSPFAFVWAIDLSYDPVLNEYPDGYNGMFKVHPSAVLHDLYTPIAAGAVSPLEIWRLIKEKKTDERSGRNDEKEEEDDDDDDDDESWMHEEL